VQDLRDPDVGCSVTATNTRTGEPPREFPSLYGTSSWQFRNEKDWRLTANSPQCRLTKRSGAGAAALPYVAGQHLGDTDAFHVDGPVKVDLMDLNGSSKCLIDLRAVDTGQTADIGELRTDSPTLTLNPMAAHRCSWAI
jgi:hypothetical protein